LNGHALRLGGLVLRKEKTGRVIVGCYSRWTSHENLSDAEAKERIGVAKMELSALADAFPQLKREIDNVGVEYEFCLDTGKAAVLVAAERDGLFSSTIKHG
jgi:hypothetical protein